MKHVCELLFWLSLLAACLLTVGDPDIIDGWIKRANDVNCTE